MHTYYILIKLWNNYSDCTVDYVRRVSVLFLQTWLIGKQQQQKLSRVATEMLFILAVQLYQQNDDQSSYGNIN